MPKRELVLGGPMTGQTIVLNGRSFKDGRLDIAAYDPVDHAAFFRYFEVSYQARIETSDDAPPAAAETEEAKPRRRGKARKEEVADAGPQTDGPDAGEFRSFGQELPEEDADGSDLDAGAEARSPL